MKNTRRNFLYQSGRLALGLGFLGINACTQESNNTASTEASTADQPIPAAKLPPLDDEGLFFKISLAQWSLHRRLQAGKMDHLDFAAVARREFGIGAIEYVNSFFKNKATDLHYLDEMNKRAADNGVKQLLIMVDGEGAMGNLDVKARAQAIENHFKWVAAAKRLGCHAIRVNLHGDGPAQRVAEAATDSLARLAVHASRSDINVIVENHGGYSSDGQWLSNIIRLVNQPNCGTLPDFGNFCIQRKDDQCTKGYDRYKGVEEMMPFAKAISAKSYQFDSQGNESKIDYAKMLQLVKKAGYKGYIGVEYEGNQLGEADGIRATKALLIKLGKQMS